MSRWRDLSDFGFPDYAVSDMGEVKNVRTSRILSQSFNQSGTYKVGLVRSPGEPPSTLVVARLVASTFLDPPLSPQFDTPINLNGDRSDNRAENLMWRPRWFATRYHQQFRRASTVHIPVVALDTDEVFATPLDAAMHYGVLEADIISDLRNHRGVWPIGYDFRVYRE